MLDLQMHITGNVSGAFESLKSELGHVAHNSVDETFVVECGASEVAVSALRWISVGVR